MSQSAQKFPSSLVYIGCILTFVLGYFLLGGQQVESSSASSAESRTPSSRVSAAPVANQVDVASVTPEQILAKLKSIRPDTPVAQAKVKPSVLPGLFEVTLGREVIYMNASGDVLIVGDMYRIEDSQLVNMQERARREADKAFAPERARLLANVKEKDLIVFPANGEAKASIYVFTDIDCGFCRRLHGQMAAYQAKGIEVRYLAFPRAGVDSESAKKLETTWCASDRHAAMTQFKQGANMPLSSCAGHPVAAQYQLGLQVGVTGTPAIVFEDGTLVPGAVSADQLAAMLKI